MNMKKINKEFVYDRLIQLFWFTVILCSLLKFLGFKEFEIPDKEVSLNYTFRVIVNLSLFVLNGIFMSLIILKRFVKIKELLVIILLNIFDYLITFNLKSPYFLIVDFSIYVIIILCFSKLTLKEILFDCVIVSIIVSVYQLLTMFYKNINTDIRNVDFRVESILQIDYYILLTLTLLRELKKGVSLYERWKTKLVFLSKRNSFKENVQQNQENVQKVEVELGYKIFIVMLSITQLFLVGTICHFVNNVILEYLLIFISFVFMRQVYGKSYHSDSVLVCTTLAVLVFVTATRLSLPLYISVLCNILIGCLVAYMMYVMYCYMNYTNYDGITLRKGMLKEDLIKLCDIAGLTEQATNRMVLKYIERKTLQEIADIEYIDYQTANQSIYRSKQKIKQALKDEPFK